MTNNEINIWEFRFFDTNEDDWVECQYYTYTDDRQFAFEQFVSDEGSIQFDMTHDGTITEEKMVEFYGSLDLVLDKVS